MNIEEVEEPETTKIYRQNPFTPAAATRKLREFTDETNMQARNHENSDEIRAPPVRHLDLATRPFTITVRTPSVTTLLGNKSKLVFFFSFFLSFLDLHKVAGKKNNNYSPNGGGI